MMRRIEDINSDESNLETGDIIDEEIEQVTSNILTHIEDIADNQNIQDEMDDYYGLSAESMIQLLKQAMEYSGIIGYFYDHMDLFKALFIKYPELLTQMED